MCGPEDLARSSPVSHFKQTSVHKPPLFSEKLENFSLYTTSIFAKIVAQKPLKIGKFSVHKIPFSEAMISSQAPLWKSGQHTPS